jgi:hypothetical protein
MKSLAIFPLDFLYDSTRPVREWLEDDAERHGEYVLACVAYARNGHFELPLRCEPRVAYDALHDTHYFIFKQDNNGTCVLVGRDLPALPADSCIDGATPHWEMT